MSLQYLQNHWLRERRHGDVDAVDAYRQKGRRRAGQCNGFDDLEYAARIWALEPFYLSTAGPKHGERVGAVFWTGNETVAALAGCQQHQQYGRQQASQHLRVASAGAGRA